MLILLYPDISYRLFSLREMKDKLNTYIIKAVKLKNRLKTKYLVVGASYAGSIIAAKLAKAGDTLLADKSQPGALMNCGGGIPEKTFKRLELNIPFAATDKITMNIKGLLRSFPARYVVVDRRDLNRGLCEKAVNAGAEFAKMRYCEHFPDKKIAIFASEQKSIEVEYEKLIFADGFHPARVRIPQRAEKKLPCGAAKVQIIEGETSYPDTLYFKITEDNPTGYSWVFPMPDKKLNIGAGGFHTGTVPDSLIDNLKTSEKLNGKIIIRGGGVLPVTPILKVQSGDTYLFGNAAGMVYALNGEGLKHIYDTSDKWADAIISGSNLNRQWRFSLTYAKLKFAASALRFLQIGEKMMKKSLYPPACRAAAKSRNIIKMD